MMLPADREKWAAHQKRINRLICLFVVALLLPFVGIFAFPTGMEEIGAMVWLLMSTGVSLALTRFWPGEFFVMRVACMLGSCVGMIGGLSVSAQYGDVHWIMIFLVTGILHGILHAHAWGWLGEPRSGAVPGYCAACEYDLTGNVSGRCPECGMEVERSG